jgi:hypothetical protein
MEKIRFDKEAEATKLFQELDILETSEYEKFNFYNNLGQSQYSALPEEPTTKKYWTRLSNTSNLTLTID